MIRRMVHICWDRHGKMSPALRHCLARIHPQVLNLIDAALVDRCHGGKPGILRCYLPLPRVNTFHALFVAQNSFLPTHAFPASQQLRLRKKGKTMTRSSSLFAPSLTQQSPLPLGVFDISGIVTECVMVDDIVPCTGSLQVAENMAINSSFSTIATSPFSI